MNFCPDSVTEHHLTADTSVFLGPRLHICLRPWSVARNVIAEPVLGTFPDVNSQAAFSGENGLTAAALERLLDVVCPDVVPQEAAKLEVFVAVWALVTRSCLSVLERDVSLEVGKAVIAEVGTEVTGEDSVGVETILGMVVMDVLTQFPQ